MDNSPDNQTTLFNLHTFYFVFPILKILFVVSLFLFLPLSANAALSATTKHTIIGSHPYFTFDGGKTKVEKSDGLLDITLSDGTIFSKSNNPSTPEKPIELPAQKQSINDIAMSIPKTLTTVNLNDLIHDPYNYWSDDNGDGQGENGISATGNITLTITDVEGKSVKRNEILNVCHSPYKVTLSSTGTLSTKFGNPTTRVIGSSDVTYYIRPKVGLPVTCWAQPNLDYSSTHENPLAPTSYKFQYYYIDGPVSEWNPDKGYLLQSLANPSANFPTVGAYGLYFKLIVGDALGKNITYSKSPASSSIGLSITDAGNNIAKVMLTGPRNGASAAQAQTAIPTTFTLYSDASKTNAIYSFTINKWFIARPGNGGGYNANFCRTTYGANYRIPNTLELTNANGPGWTAGLSGVTNNYQRRIGGGLFAEWGNMDNYGRYGNKSIYTESDFDDEWYWTSEDYGTYHRYVYSYSGWTTYGYSDLGMYRFACVMP